MPEYERNGVAVFAISYDSVEVLSAFAQEHGITFTLLSDVGSETIKRLQLLNEHVEAQQAYYGIPETERRYEGVPYPGTFMLDESGVIVDRQFEQSYRVRPSGTALLEDLLGTTVGDAKVSDQAQGPGLQAVAWLDTDVYRPQQQLRLHVAVEVEPGLHVYAPPTPSGFTPLQLDLVELDGLDAGPAPLPQGRPLTVEGLDQEFLVYEGRLQTAIPFRIEHNQGPVDLELRVRYQACSETVCHPPGELRVRLPLQGRDPA